MCLFVVDGTWSRNFNSENLGINSSDKPVGNHEKLAARSNSRRFFEENFYPANEKFYYIVSSIFSYLWTVLLLCSVSCHVTRPWQKGSYQSRVYRGWRYFINSFHYYICYSDFS